GSCARRYTDPHRMVIACNQGMSNV
ncbi:hypothetical protein A2U01_0067986, partial [Trifolium medium]|nr:hypothetical protein [Trifolium medium]